MKLNILRASTSILSRLPVVTGNGAKLFLALTIIAFSSCKKESEIGSDILPQDDLINLSSTDNFPLLTYTVREDSLRSDEAPTVQIGSCIDPNFGMVSASLYTQLTIPNSQLNLTFGTSPVLDSAALWIKYEYDFYGDTTTPQTFNVYQVVEDLFRDSAYYSNGTKQIYPGPIGSVTFNPRPRSEAVGNGDTIPSFLRIPINSSFAQLILAESNGPNLASNAAFQSFMKGFYIEPNNPGLSSGQGALLHFDLLDTLTRFTMYYHNVSDTASFSFVVNSGTAYFSHFAHDYSATVNDVQNQLQNPGQAASNEVYIQSCAGLKTRIEFPALDSLRNLGYPIAINKAELVFKADPATATANFPLNKKLYVVSVDSLGVQHIILDMLENSVYFGGSLNTTTNEYRLNIARYMQGLLSGEETSEVLFLKELYGVEEGRGAVLGSPGSSQYKMYLHLVYTRIN